MYRAPGWRSSRPRAAAYPSSFVRTPADAATVSACPSRHDVGVAVGGRRHHGLVGAIDGDGNGLGRAVDGMRGDGVDERLAGVRGLDRGAGVVQRVGQAPPAAKTKVAIEAGQVPAWKLAWPASASVMVSVPLAVSTPSSLTVPAAVPPMMAGSLTPVTVTVAVWAAVPPCRRSQCRRRRSCSGTPAARLWKAALPVSTSSVVPDRVTPATSPVG